MADSPFRTPDGTTVPSVSASTMAEVDRIAIEEVGIDLLQMMENAGRTLAMRCQATDDVASVLVLAGGGGNGGGGLACTRHLVNRGIDVTVIPDREPGEIDGAPGTQLRILESTSARISEPSSPLPDADLIVDAIIGYGLREAPRGPAKRLIEAADGRSMGIISLDVPSGLDATTGERPGVSISADEILTLALPKHGLREIGGSIRLADIAIPSVVYDGLDLQYIDPFTAGNDVALHGPCPHG